MMASKHTRRISSLFSLGSTSSDKSVDTSKSSPSLAPPTFSDEPNATIFSEPGFTESQTLTPLKTPPPLGPSLQTPPDDSPKAPVSPPDNLLPPIPQMILPPPEKLGGQTGKRPRCSSESWVGTQVETADKSEIESHVGNGGGSRPRSRVENKGGSRPESPTRLNQSITPTERRLPRRRSWLPTRSKPEPQGEVDGPGPWLIGPDEKLPYDASSLIRFQKVGNFPLSRYSCTDIDADFRCLSCGRIMVTRSYTSTQGRSTSGLLSSLTPLVMHRQER